MKTAFAILAAFLTLQLSAEESPAPKTDSDIWNEAVKAYSLSRKQGAREIFESLLNSKTHAKRAAEILGAMAFEDEDYEKACDYAQSALRGNPNDARLKGNFSLAHKSLSDKRRAAERQAEEEKDEKLRAQGMSGELDSMIKKAHEETERLMVETAALSTNTPERAVRMADNLSARALKLKDEWTKVSEKLVSSGTNEEERAKISNAIADSRAKLILASKKLEDLELEDAYQALGTNESRFHSYLKVSALPPTAIVLDEICQSNAYANVAAKMGRPWQAEANSFTECFDKRFPEWAESKLAEAAQGGDATNATENVFTAEKRDKILELMKDLKELQASLTTKKDPETEEVVLEIIAEIRKLLPNDSNEAPQENPPSDKENQDEKEDDKDGEGQEGEPNDEQDDSKEGEAQADKEDEGEKEDDKAAGAKEEPSEEDKLKEAIKEYLQKAQDRSDRIDEERKNNAGQYGLPNSRDW